MSVCLPTCVCLYVCVTAIVNSDKIWDGQSVAQSDSTPLESQRLSTMDRGHHMDR